MIVTIKIFSCTCTKTYSSKLESEKHGLDDQEKIVKVQQGKGGKYRRYRYLLLVITAIVASKSVPSLHESFCAG